MSEIAIRAEHLSKQYKIGRAQKRHDTLRDALTDGVAGLFRRNGQAETREDTIWALDDVSFEVQRGDVVGVIGRNGAGKSTLLKVLSRITKPTRGHAEIHGRVGSLLEVGTGFHPELTGRENIYLNGAILGMKRAEIDRKFDEIVAFAEVEKFIDTPVKRYSSGMYVRLAFAVAAHLEPEILMVDEVLAVGDAAFQKKCLGKMGDVAKEGRTVLFVSHNMNAVRQLCEIGIWLNGGRIEASGNVYQIIGKYLFSGNESRNGIQVPLGDRPAAITRIRFLDAHDDEIETLETGMECQVELTVQTVIPLPSVGVEFGLSDRYGTRVIFSNSAYIYGLQSGICSGTTKFICRIPELPLLAGWYTLDAMLFDESALHSRIQWEPNIGAVEVRERDVFNTGHPISPEWGTVFFKHAWTVMDGNTR